MGRKKEAEAMTTWKKQVEETWEAVACRKGNPNPCGRFDRVEIGAAAATSLAAGGAARAEVRVERCEGTRAPRACWVCGRERLLDHRPGKETDAEIETVGNVGDSGGAGWATFVEYGLALGLALRRSRMHRHCPLPRFARKEPRPSWGNRAREDFGDWDDQTDLADRATAWTRGWRPRMKPGKSRLRGRRSSKERNTR